MPKGFYDRSKAWDKGIRRSEDRERLAYRISDLVKPDSEESPNNQELGDDQGCLII